MCKTLLKSSNSPSLDMVKGWKGEEERLGPGLGGGTGVLGRHGARTGWGGGGTVWPCQCSGGKEGWHGRA